MWSSIAEAFGARVEIPCVKGMTVLPPAQLAELAADSLAEDLLSKGDDFFAVVMHSTREGLRSAENLVSLMPVANALEEACMLANAGVMGDTPGVTPGHVLWAAWQTRGTPLSQTMLRSLSLIERRDSAQVVQGALQASLQLLQQHSALSWQQVLFAVELLHTCCDSFGEIIMQQQVDALEDDDGETAMEIMRNFDPFVLMLSPHEKYAELAALLRTLLSNGETVERLFLRYDDGLDEATRDMQLHMRDTLLTDILEVLRARAGHALDEGGVDVSVCHEFLKTARRIVDGTTALGAPLPRVARERFASQAARVLHLLSDAHDAGVSQHDDDLRRLLLALLHKEENNKEENNNTAENNKSENEENTENTEIQETGDVITNELVQAVTRMLRSNPELVRAESDVAQRLRTSLLAHALRRLDGDDAECKAMRSAMAAQTSCHNESLTYSFTGVRFWDVSWLARLALLLQPSLLPAEPTALFSCVSTLPMHVLWLLTQASLETVQQVSSHESSPAFVKSLCDIVEDERCDGARRVVSALVVARLAAFVGGFSLQPMCDAPLCDMLAWRVAEMLAPSEGDCRLPVPLRGLLLELSVELLDLAEQKQLSDEAAQVLERVRAVMPEDDMSIDFGF